MRRMRAAPPTTSSSSTGVPVTATSSSVTRAVAGRRRDQLLDGRVSPGGAALLEEPEARHVLQEADTAERAGLVGEVGVSGLLGRVGGRPLGADQHPGAAG